jgi:hypothetical protein
MKLWLLTPSNLAETDVKANIAIHSVSLQNITMSEGNTAPNSGQSG